MTNSCNASNYHYTRHFCNYKNRFRHTYRLRQLHNVIC